MIRTMPSHDVSWQHSLLATGLFTQQTTDHKEPTQEEIDSYRQERDIFMDHSKKSMANVIARYL